MLQWVIPKYVQWVIPKYVEEVEEFWQRNWNSSLLSQEATLCAKRLLILATRVPTDPPSSRRSHPAVINVPRHSHHRREDQF